MRLKHGPLSRRALALGSLALAALASLTVEIPSGEPTAVAARDPWVRPFSSTSIWNMPIGSNARYADAGLPRAGTMALDHVLLHRLSPGDPMRPLHTPGDWRNRCSGSQATGVSLPIPDGLLVADARQRADGGWTTPNNVAGFLLPDGRTLVNTNAVARCSEGGPIYGYQTGKPEIDRTDLYGDGRLGSHGASRLSGIGGAIRPGELTGDAPIQHALDLLVWGKYLSYTDGGFRWPAAAADSYAKSKYLGSNPEMKMGSLLAIPPNVTPEQLGITTHVGRKLFAAMQDYGGYVTDDAYWDAHYVSVDAAAVGTFPWGGAEQADMNRIMDAAAVVTNNGPDSIGGGGAPRRPLLPELVPHAVPDGTGLLAPARLLDTRPKARTVDGAQSGAGAQDANTSTVVQVAGRGGVPHGATTALLNVTATETATAGFATVHPCGGAIPVTSTLNFGPDESVANSALVPLDAVGRACVTTSARTQLVVDVQGWSGNSASLVSSTPTRLLDTRAPGDGAREAGSVTRVKVAGVGGVPGPGQVSLVSMNLTVTNAAAPGFATAYPCDRPVPTASNVNFDAGSARANAVLVAPDPNGDVCVRLDAPAHLIVDVTGYSPAGALVQPVTPARIADTRPGAVTVDGGGAGGGIVPARGVLAVDVLGRAGIPASGVGSVAVNVTSTGSSRRGFLTVYPCGGEPPVASNVNHAGGRSAAGKAVVPLGDGGQVCVFSETESHVVVDVTGFVAG